MRYINRADIPSERRKYLLKQLHDYTKKILANDKLYTEKLAKLEQKHKEKVYSDKYKLQFPTLEKSSE